MSYTPEEQKAIVLHTINDNPQSSLAQIAEKTGFSRGVAKNITKALGAKGLVKSLPTENGVGYEFSGTELDLKEHKLPATLGGEGKAESGTSSNKGSNASHASAPATSTSKYSEHKKELTKSSVASLLVAANGRFRTKETLLLGLNGTQEELTGILDSMVADGYATIDESLMDSVADDGVFKMTDKTHELIAKEASKQPTSNTDDSKGAPRVTVRKEKAKQRKSEDQSVKPSILAVLEEDLTNKFAPSGIKGLLAEKFDLSIGQTRLISILEEMHKNGDIVEHLTAGGRKKYGAVAKPKPAKEPVVEAAPVAETPAPAKEPVVEAPVAETPAPAKEPVVEAPVVETPAPAPVVEEPVTVTEAPATEAPVSDILQGLTESLSSDALENAPRIREVFELLIANNEALEAEVRQWRALAQGLMNAK